MNEEKKLLVDSVIEAEVKGHVEVIKKEIVIDPTYEESMKKRIEGWDAERLAEFNEKKNKSIAKD